MMSMSSMHRLSSRLGMMLNTGLVTRNYYSFTANSRLITTKVKNTFSKGTTLLHHAKAAATMNIPKQQQQLRMIPLGLQRYLSTSEQIMSSSDGIIDDEPFTNVPISEMSSEELEDTSTIHGWHLIHSPPRKLPNGALIGTVVSDKMDKTVNVAVVRYRIIRKVRKRIRYTRKFMAHDEQEVANMGDIVMITPCHRISKNKHFMLREIIRAKGQL